MRILLSSTGTDSVAIGVETPVELQFDSQGNADAAGVIPIGLFSQDDAFEFELNALSVVTASSTTSGYRVALLIRDRAMESDAYISPVRREGQSTDRTEAWILGPGRYLISVPQTPGFRDGVPYSFRLNRLALTAEAGIAPTTVRISESPAARTRLNGVTGDKRIAVYQFRTEAPVAFSLTNHSSAPQQITLIDADGNRENLNDAAVRLEPGTWYLVIQSRSPSNYSYSAWMHRLQADDHANTPGPWSTPVSPSATDGMLTLRGHLNYGSDRDVFRLDVPAATAIRLIGGSGGTPYVHLYDSNYQTLASWRVNSDGDHQYVSIPAGVCYFEVVGSYSDRIPGEYSIQFLADDRANFWKGVRKDDSIRIYDTTTLSCLNDYQGDIDVFRINLLRERVLHFEAPPDVQLKFRYFDGSARFMGPTDFVKAESGIYFLEVTHLASSGSGLPAQINVICEDIYGPRVRFTGGQGRSLSVPRIEWEPAEGAIDYEVAVVALKGNRVVFSEKG
ncbi:MAG: hypothetical protein KDA85_01995, partial [Planctomycetaceae bacterium]|nr:hypothetical protein [Planctomycetaceae bacterium]